MARASIYLLILAVIAPFLYDRHHLLLILLANRPGKPQPIINIKERQIRFRDQIRNCEDVVLDEGAGVAILSCDPGRDRWNTVMGTFHPREDMENGEIWLYDYSTPGLADDGALKPLTLKNFNTKDFHPLGIEFEASSSTLYIVNHAQTGSVIEVFNISVKSSTATHIRTIRHPLVYSPNSIVALGDGKIFFTNDHYFRSRDFLLLSKVETFSGLPGGSVVFLDTNNPDSAKTLTRVPFANGIAMLNATTLVVGSSSKAGLYFFQITPEYDLISKGYVRTPSSVDNVSVDGNGVVQMAGHVFAPALVAVAKNRHLCNAKSDKEEERRACDCGAPSWAAEWTEEKGLRELYKGYEICGSTTAVRDVKRGVGMITMLYDRGIMVYN